MLLQPKHVTIDTEKQTKAVLTRSWNGAAVVSSRPMKLSTFVLMARQDDREPLSTCSRHDVHPSSTAR